MTSISVESHSGNPAISMEKDFCAAREPVRFYEFVPQQIKQAFQESS
jgi:hypothetical protein